MLLSTLMSSRSLGSRKSVLDFRLLGGSMSMRSFAQPNVARPRRSWLAASVDMVDEFGLPFYPDRLLRSVLNYLHLGSLLLVWILARAGSVACWIGSTIYRLSATCLGRIVDAVRRWRELLAVGPGPMGRPARLPVCLVQLSPERAVGRWCAPGHGGSLPALCGISRCGDSLGTGCAKGADPRISALTARRRISRLRHTCLMLSKFY